MTRGINVPPYSPAVTSARKADKVSRAIMRFPTAAWMGTSNSCRGMTLSAWRSQRGGHMGIIYACCITIKGTELLTQFLHPHSPYALLSASMHDQGQGVNGLVVQQKNHLIKDR
jgi:hypothetical protein